MVDRAYDSLRAAVLDGSFRPGQRLRALRIARELKISRTPVKEALARLEQEGLVAREADSGYIVRGLSVGEILNLYKVREALEIEAAREALANLTDADFAAMRAILDNADKLLAKKKYPEFLQISRKFHNLIAERTGNGILQEILGNLDARFWSIGRVVVSRHAQRAQDIRRENRAILDALIGSDARLVEKAVRAHVQGAAANVRLFIEREPHLFVVAA